MKFEIYTANCTGNKKNCYYPNIQAIDNKEKLLRAIEYDHVCALYKEGYRSNDNFIKSDLIIMDVDNDDFTGEVLSIDEVSELFSEVDYAIVPSRHHLIKKEDKEALPRFHVLFPIREIDNAEQYALIKEAIHNKYPFFDGNALDAARFFFGHKTDEVYWHEGWMSIADDVEDEIEKLEEKGNDNKSRNLSVGNRNNALSHFAGRVLKKYGPCEKARELFDEEASKCDSPLSDDELNAIWKSATKFYLNKVVKDSNYVSPENYNQDFKKESLIPKDFTDLGEARVFVELYGEILKYSEATGFLVYDGIKWCIDKTFADALVEDFLDRQLSDASALVEQTEEKLKKLGSDEELLSKRSIKLSKDLDEQGVKLLKNLMFYDAYKKNTLKCRNYGSFNGFKNMAKPMAAVDVLDLDANGSLLNTPLETYDLIKGLEGKKEHDPLDLITNCTLCSPSSDGEEIWLDALNLFFCDEKELIAYVQEVVGLAAYGKVYEESLIIAYGGGANGKSTFWNAVSQVLGTYSGKMSPDALLQKTNNNIKPEMAELKGKRLVLASELDEGVILSTGVLKRLCSTDTVKAERKYCDPFEFVPNHTLVLCTNHLPQINAIDDGTWRRIVVIPFNAKIEKNSDIKNYASYLVEHAGGAIMKWIIEGAKRVALKDFKPDRPKCVNESIEDYRSDNDWIGDFIKCNCLVDKKYNQASGELYAAYRAYCIAQSESPRSTKDFYGALKTLGYPCIRRKDGRRIMGLKLNEEQSI